MEIKDYISSGIIELYAAGALDENQSKEVEAILRSNKEAREEFEKIQKAAYLAAAPVLKTPPSRVKESILGKIQTIKSEKTIQRVSSPPEIPVKSSFNYLMAASITFLLLSLIANYYLWTKLSDANNQIAFLTDQNRIMVQENNTVNHKLNLASKDMEIMKDRNYKMIDMKGLEKSPGSNVVAFWNPQTKKVYVGVNSLPVPPKDKQYQLWAISNGKPVDGGMMDVDPSDKSLHEMKSMDDAQAFAITLEPKGGSVNPTMDQMYVMGTL